VFRASSRARRRDVGCDRMERLSQDRRHKL